MDEGSVHDGLLSESPDSSFSRPKLQLPISCDPPGADLPPKQLVWIVFGGTGHMGRSLVKSAIAHDDLATTVGRVHETSPETMEALASSYGSNCLGALCDVRDRASVDRVVARTLARFGRIDVVVNCSGYGVIGACEDQDDHEIRNQFETNFMGTLHIIHATLPLFRRQSAGRYLIFSSTSGALGVPGLGPYCATKYAVEGLVEAMLYEVDSFNIKATLVEPGLVRRDDNDHPSPVNDDGSGKSTAEPPPPLQTWGHFLVHPASEPYAGETAPAMHVRRMVRWLGDRQPTSAVKCAELVWQLAHCAYPPLRLLLGSYAVESIRDRMRSITEELEDWKHLNFPVAPEIAPDGMEVEEGKIGEDTDEKMEDVLADGKTVEESTSGEPAIASMDVAVGALS